MIGGRSLVASVWAVGSAARSRVVWGAPMQAAETPVDETHAAPGPAGRTRGSRRTVRAATATETLRQTTVAIPRPAAGEAMPAPVALDPVEPEPRTGSDTDVGDVHTTEAIPRPAAVGVLRNGDVHTTEAIPRGCGGGCSGIGADPARRVGAGRGRLGRRSHHGRHPAPSVSAGHGGGAGHRCRPDRRPPQDAAPVSSPENAVRPPRPPDRDHDSDDQRHRLRAPASTPQPPGSDH